MLLAFGGNGRPHEATGGCFRHPLLSLCKTSTRMKTRGKKCFPKPTTVGVAPLVTTVSMTTIDKPLKNAPAPLLNLYKHPNGFPTKAILGRLLTDPRMKNSWNEIEENVLRNLELQLVDSSKKTNLLQSIEKATFLQGQYRRLWSAISYAYVESLRPLPSRMKNRKNFLHIAKITETLAQTIADGPLDRLAYEFFPVEMAQAIFDVPEWSNLGSEQRHIAVEKMKKKLVLWPSLTDILAEVSRKAKDLAKAALTEERFAVNNTQDRQVNYFLQHLARYFYMVFKRPMTKVLAPLASVVFEKPTLESFTIAFVKKALRHTKPSK